MAPQESLRPIIAIKKEGKANPDAGLITPIRFINNDGSYSTVPPDFFAPKGEIFVAGGYTEDIENIYSDQELFKLNFYQEVENYTESQAKYRTTTRHYDQLNIESIGPLELNVVLDVKELPSAENPYVMLPYSRANIFVCDDELILGPFEMAKDEAGNKLRVIERLNLLPGLRAHHVYRFTYEKAEQLGLLEYLSINGDKKCYLRNFVNTYQDIVEGQEDFISDEALLKWGASKQIIEKKEDRPTRKALKSWKDALSALSTDASKDDLKRRTRLVQLLEQLESHDDFWENSVRSAILSNKPVLEEYVKNHEQELLGKELQILKEKIDKDEATLRQELRVLEIEKAKLKQEIEEAHQNKKEKEEKLFQDVEKKDALLTEKIKNAEETLTDIQAQIKEQLDKLDLTEDIESLQNKASYFEQHLKELERKERKLKDSALPNALRDLKLNLDIIHGSFNQLVLKSSNDNTYSNISLYEKEAFTSPQNYIDFLSNYIEDRYNRNTTYASLANYLISLANNFLVVFAGSPGCGKTSTAYLLAEALGLSKETGTFLPVSVSRGWTSQRDILGYFNPLNSTFQPARTGLSHFLNSKEGLTKTLKISLLDEANLSPIEHYWADFLHMCDEDVCRDVDLGGLPENNFTVCNATRFIATINNDNTTERLSPRLIDRAPIIRFSEEPINLTQDADIDSEEIENISKTLPLENFESMFKTPAAKATFLNKELDVLNEISKTLSGKADNDSQRLFLSHRKMASMKRYCTAARDIFKNDNEPLDYAIAQFILPIIEGFGDGFGKRLCDLREMIKTGYPISHALLDDIILRGKRNHHSYSYFE